MHIEIAAHMQNMTRRDKGLAQEIFKLKVTRTHYNLIRQYAYALKWLAFHIFPIPFKNTQKVSLDYIMFGILHNLHNFAL